MSLVPKSREFDYFPNLNTRGLPSNQKTIVESMKDGTYTPFMTNVPYSAEIEPESKSLIKAFPESKLFNFSEKDTFDYSAVYKKKKGQVYTRLEVIERQFDKTNIPILPRYYHNPLQYFDHILLADGYVNSFAGTVVDTYVDFIMPKTLGPVLKLRNPDAEGSPQEQQKVIEANQEIIECLKAVDGFYSDDGPTPQDNYLGIPIQQKFKALITNHLVFGRNCLVFENWEHLPTFEFNGVKYDDIPNVLKIIQSIDMGMAEIDAYTGKLGGIYMYNSVPFVSAKNMIYLVNKYASPMIGSLYYGFSIMQRAIDPVRLYRRILAQNFPQFIRSSHSGMGYFLFDSTQYPEDIRDKIRTSIINSYKAGEMGIIDYANIKDFDFKEVKIHPEIEPLINLKNSLIKVIVSILGLPQSLIFDEAAANRACYSEDTLTLTESGLKQFRDIDWKNEKIATLNPETNCIEYHYPDALAVYDYEGDMIHIKTKNQDVLVTPDHDMWISNSHDPKCIKFEKIKANKLAERKEFVFAEFGKWEGIENVQEWHNLDSVIMSSNQHITQQISKIKLDDWLEFLGYYLSEGTKSRPEKYGSKYFVSIAQNQTSKSFEKMQALMNRMPFVYYDNVDKANCHRWRFSNKQLVHNLSDTGILHDTKQVPRWIFKLKSEKLQILFDALIAGDGHVGKNGIMVYYTTSKQLAQDVQEIALKLGHGANIKLHYKASENRHEAYRVFITNMKRSLRRIRNIDISTVPYKGKVYCFSVKNHLYVTSRNGTMTVQGNTLVGKVISFINNQVTQLRNSIGEQIASQWYMRNFRILYAEKKEILQKFIIGVEFEEMDLETKLEKVERLLQETQLNPYKDEYIGEELGDTDYLDHIDTDKRDKQEQQTKDPFGSMGGRKPQSMFKVTDSDTGNITRIKKTPV